MVEFFFWFTLLNPGVCIEALPLGHKFLNWYNNVLDSVFVPLPTWHSTATCPRFLAPGLRRNSLQTKQERGFINATANHKFLISFLHLREGLLPLDILHSTLSDNICLPLPNTLWTGLRNSANPCYSELQSNHCQTLRSGQHYNWIALLEAERFLLSNISKVEEPGTKDKKDISIVLGQEVDKYKHINTMYI